MAKLYFKLLLAMAYLTVAFGLQDLASKIFSKKIETGGVPSCDNSKTFRIKRLAMSQIVYRDLGDTNCNVAVSVGSVDISGVLTPETELQACLPPVSIEGNKYRFYRVGQTEDQVVVEVPTNFKYETNPEAYAEEGKNAPLVAIVINGALKVTSVPLTKGQVDELRAISDPCKDEQVPFLEGHKGINRTITTIDASTAA